MGYQGINITYHIIEQQGELCNWFDGEVVESLLAPEDGHLQGGAGSVALDDARYVQVAPVPNVVISNLVINSYLYTLYYC